MISDSVICCDKCKKGFELRSLQIKKTSVECVGNVLMLEYFTCPFCRTVYKVLLVDETKYQELVGDLKQVQKRIRRQHNKGNLISVQKLYDMAQRKQKRIEAYVNSVSKIYPGSFMLATKNNQQEEHVVYLP